MYQGSHCTIIRSGYVEFRTDGRVVANTGIGRAGTDQRRTAQYRLLVVEHLYREGTAFAVAGGIHHFVGLYRGTDREGIPAGQSRTVCLGHRISTVLRHGRSRVGHHSAAQGGIVERHDVRRAFDIRNLVVHHRDGAGASRGVTGGIFHFQGYRIGTEVGTYERYDGGIAGATVDQRADDTTVVIAGQVDVVGRQLGLARPVQGQGDGGLADRYRRHIIADGHREGAGRRAVVGQVAVFPRYRGHPYRKIGTGGQAADQDTFQVRAVAVVCEQRQGVGNFRTADVRIRTLGDVARAGLDRRCFVIGHFDLDRTAGGVAGRIRGGPHDLGDTRREDGAVEAVGVRTQVRRIVVRQHEGGGAVRRYAIIRRGHVEFDATGRIGASTGIGRTGADLRTAAQYRRYVVDRNLVASEVEASQVTRLDTHGVCAGAVTDEGGCSVTIIRHHGIQAVATEPYHFRLCIRGCRQYGGIRVIECEGYRFVGTSRGRDRKVGIAGRADFDFAADAGGTSADRVADFINNGMRTFSGGDGIKRSRRTVSTVDQGAGRAGRSGEDTETVAHFRRTAVVQREAAVLCAKRTGEVEPTEIGFFLDRDGDGIAARYAVVREGIGHRDGAALPFIYVAGRVDDTDTGEVTAFHHTEGTAGQGRGGQQAVEVDHFIRENAELEIIRQGHFGSRVIRLDDDVMAFRLFTSRCTHRHTDGVRAGTDGGIERSGRAVVGHAGAGPGDVGGRQAVHAVVVQGATERKTQDRIGFADGGGNGEGRVAGSADHHDLGIDVVGTDAVGYRHGHQDVDGFTGKGAGCRVEGTRGSVGDETGRAARESDIGTDRNIRHDRQLYAAVLADGSREGEMTVRFFIDGDDQLVADQVAVAIRQVVRHRQGAVTAEVLEQVSELGSLDAAAQGNGEGAARFGAADQQAFQVERFGTVPADGEVIDKVRVAGDKGRGDHDVVCLRYMAARGTHRVGHGEVAGTGLSVAVRIRNVGGIDGVGTGYAAGNEDVTAPGTATGGVRTQVDGEREFARTDDVIGSDVPGGHHVGVRNDGHGANGRIAVAEAIEADDGHLEAGLTHVRAHEHVGQDIGHAGGALAVVGDDHPFRDGEGYIHRIGAMLASGRVERQHEVNRVCRTYHGRRDGIVERDGGRTGDGIALISPTVGRDEGNVNQGIGRATVQYAESTDRILADGEGTGSCGGTVVLCRHQGGQVRYHDITAAVGDQVDGRAEGATVRRDLRSGGIHQDHLEVTRCGVSETIVDGNGRGLEQGVTARGQAQDGTRDRCLHQRTHTAVVAGTGDEAGEIGRGDVTDPERGADRNNLVAGAGGRRRGIVPNSYVGNAGCGITGSVRSDDPQVVDDRVGTRASGTGQRYRVGLHGHVIVHIDGQDDARGVGAVIGQRGNELVGVRTAVENRCASQCIDIDGDGCSAGYDRRDVVQRTQGDARTGDLTQRTVIRIRRTAEGRPEVQERRDHRHGVVSFPRQDRTCQRILEPPHEGVVCAGCTADTGLIVGNHYLADPVRIDRVRANSRASRGHVARTGRTRIHELPESKIPEKQTHQREHHADGARE